MVVRQGELRQLHGADDGSEGVLDLVRELTHHSANRLQALCVQRLVHHPRLVLIDLTE